MEGVVIYADDDVLTSPSNEYQIYQELIKQENLTILPIIRLSDLKRSLISISPIKCLILDWSFIRLSDNPEMPNLSENPMAILREYDIHSLIYIYCREPIPEELKTEIEQKFGASKVQFRQKGNNIDVRQEVQIILGGVEGLEQQNSHMRIPEIWSQSINKSVHRIFSEFEQATPQWIREMRDTAIADHSDPVVEIINVFQNVLAESLLQTKELRDAISMYQPNSEEVQGRNIAQLYRRILYSKIERDTPFTTGDIFKFSDTQYGILITPECEIMNRLEDRQRGGLEFLLISPNDFETQINKLLKVNIMSEYNGCSLSKKKGYGERIFNNKEIALHFLPTFPFEEECLNKGAVINFKTGFVIKSRYDFIYHRTNYKLNAPYIHQLRQRFLAYFGRYGVSALPQSLKDYNLTKENNA